jgi:excisionase family DNA binding protein
LSEEKKVLNAVQAAELLGAHVESVRRLARKGEIPSYKIGKDWRFNAAALRNWAETHHLRQQSPLILVVDDEKSFRTTSRIFLESDGYRVATASNGEEALDLARRESLDMVLLDLIMPGISGVEVLKELHRMDHDLPVVVVTAYPDGELMLEALRYPPVMLLPKPLEKTTLLRTVHRVLKGTGGGSNH